MDEHDAIRAEKDKATAAIRAGKLKDALAACRNVLRAVPDDVDTCHRTAAILSKLGRQDEALELFRRVVTLYRDQEQPAKVLAVQKLILQLDPSDPEALASVKPTPRRPLFVPPHEPTKPPPVRVTPKTIEQLPAFASIAPADREALAAGLGILSRHKGESIPREGLLILVSGVASVERPAAPEDDLELDLPTPSSGHAELRQPGALLNAAALFVDVPSEESITAATDCVLLTLKKAVLDGLSASRPSLRDALFRLGKDALLSELIHRSPLLAPLAEVNQDMLLAQAQVRALPAGVAIVRQGELAKGLYALVQGRCRVAHHTEDGTAEYPSFRAGDAFGELSLLAGAPAGVTIETATTCVVLGLSRPSVLAAAEAYPLLRSHLMQQGVEREARAVDWARRTAKIQLL